MRLVVLRLLLPLLPPVDAKRPHAGLMWAAAVFLLRRQPRPLLLPPVDVKRPHAGWKWTAVALHLLLPLPPVDVKRPHAGWRLIVRVWTGRLPLRLRLPPVVVKRPHAGQRSSGRTLPLCLLP